VLERPPPLPPAPPPSHTLRNLGLVLGGVGAVALAGGLVSYAMARAHFNNAVSDGCTQLSCTGQARSEYMAAGRSLDIFNVAAIAGGTLLAGGAVLVLAGRW
jgi:hypothetical protein